MAVEIDTLVDFRNEADANPYVNADLVHLNSDDDLDKGMTLSGVYTPATTGVGETVKLAWAAEIDDYSRPVVAQIILSDLELANTSAHRGPAICVRSGGNIGHGYWLRIIADAGGSRIQLNKMIARGGYSAQTFAPNYINYTLSPGDTVSLVLNPDATLTAYYNGEAIAAITQIPLAEYTTDLVPAVCAYRSSSTIAGSAWGFGYGGVEAEAPPVSGPYPGTHTVTDLTSINNSQCLYNGQALPVQLGTLISFEDETTTNNWAVTIDAQGFPEINAGAGVGADTFLYSISNDGGATWSDPGTVTTTLLPPAVA
jgi:hypothetical protein